MTGPRPSIATIKRAVADAFGVPLSAMVSEERSFASCHPRQGAMSLALDLTGRSSSVVGRYFGGRDHSTVLHARRAVLARCSRDRELDRKIRRLRARLLAPAPAPPESQLAFLDGPLFDLAEGEVHA